MAGLAHRRRNASPLRPAALCLPLTLFCPPRVVLLAAGMPKGVAISHLGACNTCEDINERFGIEDAFKVGTDISMAPDCLPNTAVYSQIPTHAGDTGDEFNDQLAVRCCAEDADGVYGFTPGGPAPAHSYTDPDDAVTTDGKL